MNQEVSNNLLKLYGVLCDLEVCDQYDFENDDADDLDKLHSELEALYAKSDEAIYDLKEMVDRLRVEKRREEEAEDYESESRHRKNLIYWHNNTRM